MKRPTFWMFVLTGMVIAYGNLPRPFNYIPLIISGSIIGIAFNELITINFKKQMEKKK